jgi:3-hydroxyanthranilate 3,4-dioxygenase
MERVAVSDIETQLPQIFSRFYSSLQHRTCSVCGTVMQAPA